MQKKMLEKENCVDKYNYIYIVNINIKKNAIKIFQMEHFLPHMMNIFVQKKKKKKQKKKKKKKKKRKKKKKKKRKKKKNSFKKMKVTLL